MGNPGYAYFTTLLNLCKRVRFDPLREEFCPALLSGGCGGDWLCAVLGEGTPVHEGSWGRGNPLRGFGPSAVVG